MPNACPECNKDDAIQKLTSITAAGEASGTFSGPSVGLTRVDGKWGTTGGYTTLSGSTMTELARKLQPPDKPRVPLRVSLNAFVVLFYLAIIGCLFLLVGLSISEGEATLALIFTGLAVIAGLFVALTLPQFSNQEAEAKRKVAVQEKAWNSAMQKYRRAYYCFRDDIVFDPTSGATSSPDELHSFLYSN